MPRRRRKPGEIVAKPRLVDGLVSRGQSVADLPLDKRILKEAASGNG